jgi:acyl carrier protein
MNNSMFEQIRQIASDVFGVPQGSVLKESSPDTIPTWDSIQHLNFVLALEQEFSVQFEPGEVEQILSIELAVMLVEEVQARAKKG